MDDSISQTDGVLSRFYLRVIIAWFLTSAFVVFEPAPFDLLFPVVAIIFLMRKDSFRFPKESRILFPSLLIFFIANLMPILVVDDVARAGFYISTTVYMFVLASFIALLVMNYGYEVLHKLMGAYTLVAVISGVIGVLAIMRLMPGSLIEHVTSFDGTRARAFFKDPNVYAPYLLVPMLYTVDRFFADKKRMWLWGGAALSLMFGILVGFSRAAWGVSILALVGYFLLISLAEGRFTQFLKYMAYFIFFIMISGAILAAFASEAKMTNFITDRFAVQDYDTDRFAVQRTALQSGLENPFGIGPGQSEMIFESKALRRTGATHSLYLRVLAETGIIGALSFLSIIIITIRKALWLSFFGMEKYRSLHCAFAAALGAMLVNSFVIDSIHWRHFFVLIGLIWGLDIYNRWQEK